MMRLIDKKVLEKSIRNEWISRQDIIKWLMKTHSIEKTTAESAVSKFFAQRYVMVAYHNRKAYCRIDPEYMDALADFYGVRRSRGYS